MEKIDWLTATKEQKTWFFFRMKRFLKDTERVWPRFLDEVSKGTKINFNPRSDIGNFRLGTVDPVKVNAVWRWLERNDPETADAISKAFNDEFSYQSAQGNEITNKDTLRLRVRSLVYWEHFISQHMQYSGAKIEHFVDPLPIPGVSFSKHGIDVYPAVYRGSDIPSPSVRDYPILRTKLSFDEIFLGFENTDIQSDENLKEIYLSNQEEEFQIGSNVTNLNYRDKYVVSLEGIKDKPALLLVADDLANWWLFPLQGESPLCRMPDKLVQIPLTADMMTFPIIANFPSIRRHVLIFADEEFL